MATQYRCENESRKRDVAKHATLNGIDFLEVVDRGVPEALRQRTLLVHWLKPVTGLRREDFEIEGGVRVTPVGIDWAYPVAEIPAGTLSAAEAAIIAAVPDPDHVLAIRTAQAGDYSFYTLRLLGQHKDFDPQLSAVRFSFKVECPADFDCADRPVCPPPPRSEPAIDYLAKDYASFRRLMLDRLSVVIPQWKERNAADTGVAIVEVLANAADYLSYYQDAVATEAYLGTARQRTSVRRHARLLDYPMHDGVNARVWVQIEAAASNTPVPAGTRILSHVDTQARVLAPASKELDAAMRQNPVVFETMEDALLSLHHNTLRFYAWGNEQCCLPKGATRATLADDPNKRLTLRAGDVLIFEEVLGPLTGLPADADPARRHAVRLARVQPEARLKNVGGQPQREADPNTIEDPLNGQLVVEIEWRREDALPFPLCLSSVVEGTAVPDVSVARGNIVLADNGLTVGPESLDPEQTPFDEPYRPRLRQAPVVFAASYSPEDARKRPASSALVQNPREALPHVALRDGDDVWRSRLDLLGSGRFAQEFVVEIDDDGGSRLRFGDGVLGMRPPGGSKMLAQYRVGGGSAGNVGREALAHVVSGLGGVAGVRNPLPAVGGTAPEPVEQVRLYAPQAFREQRRAITEEDYASVAERHPDVQKAAATIRWTGSWHTVFLTIDRRGGKAVDDAFQAEVRDVVEPYRLAGHDLEVDGPEYVALDIVLTVCVAPGHFRDQVRQALLRAFGNQDYGGQRGFFHPDNLTFGQTIYLSRVIAAAMSVAGVLWVDVDDTPPKPNRFRRWGRPAAGEIAAGAIQLDRLEIARVDNDPNAAENGRIEFIMQGGL